MFVLSRSAPGYLVIHAVVTVALVSGVRGASAQTAVQLCEGALGVLRDSVGMVAVAGPDTIDDWRTGRRVAGCSVTAAGATTRADSVEARVLFERIRASGWERTPDPRDSPNEASLRFRRNGADCLFSYYTLRSALGTEAERTVSMAVDRQPGDRLFNVYVMCTPATPASSGGVDSSPMP